MKIIEYHATAQNVTRLPSEVIDIIIHHVRLHRSPRVVQRDLWSCCLVTQEWYAATIKYLYEAPLLLPRNFSEFAKTLSPALSSRVRRLGLEDLVQHLDMGLLAYESQKSTTSRLLSRTKSSLKTFVAPAVSFSTTSLAPLSKCIGLERLDLSRDQYGFTLAKLLRSIKELHHLEWLSLPKDCPLSSIDLEQIEQCSWPVNLVFVQFNTSNSNSLVVRDSDPIAKLPKKLKSLTFNNCTSYEFFGMFETGSSSQIKRLCVRVNRCDGFFNFNSIVRPFPQLKWLSVPAMTQWLFRDLVHSATGNSWSLTAMSEDSIASSSLEVLILEESPDFPYSDHIRIDEVRRFVTKCPNLLRIEVPEAYLDVDNFADSSTDDINAVLSDRAKTMGEDGRIGMDEVGIFITEPRSNAGVGLKRSFQYSAND